jgi:pantothenate synthetase
VTLIKAETDGVVVARASAGLAASHENEALAPRSQGLALARRLASVLKVHRAIQAAELSALILITAIIDVGLGSLAATRVLVITALVIGLVIAAAHLVAIVASRRLQ